MVSAQNYVPDMPYRATSIAGVRVLGDAAWRAEKGEYVGTPKCEAGGWLILDRSLQDVGVFGELRCTGGCKTGVLLRAEKTASGMKGVYVALAGEEPAVYAVTLDAAAKSSRANGFARLAASCVSRRRRRPRSPRGRGGRGGGRAAAGRRRSCPSAAGDGVKADDWNLVELLLDAS